MTFPSESKVLSKVPSWENVLNVNKEKINKWLAMRFIRLSFDSNVDLIYRIASAKFTSIALLLAVFASGVNIPNL